MNRELPSSNNTAEPPFDVLVVGGGIQGAGVAQAAQAAGYRTLVVEKATWAAGTSSKSSKLIHGGLRYLQSGDFSLVRESLHERALLLKLAPGLVHGNWFTIPIYRNSRYRPWQIRAGLSLYWLLTGCREEGRFEVIPKSEWSQLTGLKTEGLQTVFRYRDAQTDDAKLTAAVIQSAVSLGAETRCPATLISAQKTPDGFRVQLESNEGVETVYCRLLVNAAGPWINRVAERVSPHPDHLDIELVQGAHLVMEHKISDQCFYLESPEDGRAVFVLPWYEGTLLGTTETAFNGDPDQAAATREEKRYLLNVLHHYFPHYSGKICGDMAGLRVLPKEQAGFHYRSREVQLVTSDRYLAIYGGKLTGYRATAEKAMRQISKMLGNTTKQADTRTLPLTLPPENNG
ncbi:glycerol-3-phosphate dehydrogenase/oxidase [Porticoccus sp.]